MKYNFKILQLPLIPTGIVLEKNEPHQKICGVIFKFSRLAKIIGASSKSHKGYISKSSYLCTKPGHKHTHFLFYFGDCSFVSVCNLTSSKVIMFGAFGFNSCPLSPVFWVPLLYATQPKQGISYEVRYSSINQAYHKTSHMSIKLKCLFLGCLTDSVSLTLHHSCIFPCDLSCDCAAFERLKGKVDSDYFIIFIVFTVFFVCATSAKDSRRKTRSSSNILFGPYSYRPISKLLLLSKIIGEVLNEH